MPNCTRVCKPLHLSDPSVLDLDGCTEATQAEGASCRVGCPAHMLGNASLQRCVGPSNPFGVLLCAARTLKRHWSTPGHSIAALIALKRSLCAMTGGKEPNIRPKRPSQTRLREGAGRVTVDQGGAVLDSTVE